MDKYLILEKKVGETPLSCAEDYRAQHPELEGVSMAYAGRLDPMASGKLLILLGEECKNQTSYHGLDKEYEFSVLFGIESDSLDVLGRLNTVTEITSANKETVDHQPGDCARLSLAARSAQSEGSLITSLDLKNTTTDSESSPSASTRHFGFASGRLAETDGNDSLVVVAQSFLGTISQPYPRFSSKTVQGKPLHTWTMEGRLDEIEIPTKESTVYKIELTKTEIFSREEVVEKALAKVNSIPPVTELRKALGNDFRRVDVRQDWDNILNNTSLPSEYKIAHFRCIASSGTYMRTLASEIAKKLGTVGLAWSIHRDIIGIYDSNKNSWHQTF